MHPKSNGTGDKLRVAGRCLDCLMPAEMDELKGRVDRIQEHDLPERDARIELVARNCDRISETATKLECIALAFEKALGNLGEVGKTIGRLGARKPRALGSKS